MPGRPTVGVKLTAKPVSWISGTMYIPAVLIFSRIDTPLKTVWVFEVGFLCLERRYCDNRYRKKHRNLISSHFVFYREYYSMIQKQKRTKKNFRLSEKTLRF
jgi:hypothetical protein